MTKKDEIKVSLFWLILLVAIWFIFIISLYFIYYYEFPKEFTKIVYTNYTNELTPDEIIKYKSLSRVIKNESGEFLIPISQYRDSNEFKIFMKCKGENKIKGDLVKSPLFLNCNLEIESGESDGFFKIIGGIKVDNIPLNVKDFAPFEDFIKKDNSSNWGFYNHCTYPNDSSLKKDCNPFIYISGNKSRYIYFPLILKDKGEYTLLFYVTKTNKKGNTISNFLPQMEFRVYSYLEIENQEKEKLRNFLLLLIAAIFSTPIALYNIKNLIKK